MNSSEEGLESDFVDDESDLSAEAFAQEVGGLAALKKLREKLSKAVEEKQEYLDGWQRARADFANFKRDETGRSVEAELRTKTELGEAIIPALDSFEMALRDKSFEAADANLKKGFEAVYSNLLKSLERAGIRRFEPTGEKFDPYTHEALREVPTDDASKDHIVESVHRAGYAVGLPAGAGERIIRPAQVSVFAHTN